MKEKKSMVQYFGDDRRYKRMLEGAHNIFIAF